LKEDPAVYDHLTTKYARTVCSGSGSSSSSSVAVGEKEKKNLENEEKKMKGILFDSYTSSLA
jgi:hypothetical protein